MSHACIISGAILCMHGGISPQLNSLDDINAIPKPYYHMTMRDKKEYTVSVDILWSDPHKDVKEFSVNSGRQTNNILGEAGYAFGFPQVTEILNKLHLNMIMRGHQFSGVGFIFGHYFLTIFSSSAHTNTPGRDTIDAVVVIDEAGLFSTRHLYQGIQRKFFTECGVETEFTYEDDETRFRREMKRNERENADYRVIEKREVKIGENGARSVIPPSDDTGFINETTTSAAPAASAAPTPRLSPSPSIPSIPSAPTPSSLPIPV
ncbi:hypothetical protein PENTCL1PPCAC_7435 [Pristionchus entomophagus]|uniref:Calcineurin-like phosphoesterase domain-containing protein n=1 Tax=Pristionchus entomophagus TaxID=358040 RepID=A0AAV5SYV5_9BILA|nr:hypothetical protein PENTCL1PPCAC_7435 [Pristionchus entomophagus]